MKHDYKNIIVNKPWGYEYLVFENSKVALWHLKIKSGHKTSLHCHPRKKTGLILLNGKATINFLNNKTILTAPANVMIRAGLFHSTHANFNQDIDVFEIETPVNKKNIVRLEDDYGRENQPYENYEHYSNLNEDCLILPKEFKKEIEEIFFLNKKIYLFKNNNLSFLNKFNSKDIVIFLKGGLYSSDNEPILVAGDAVSCNTVNILSNKFNLSKNVQGIIIPHN